MLEFKKKILTKVSFDGSLFEKELAKALKWLVPREIMELKAWCYVHFSDRYKEVLDRCFHPVPELV